MRNLALYAIALPIVFWFAQGAWMSALALVRRDAKEAAALALAREYGPFARAYATVKSLGGSIPATSPWHRPENGGPA